jgi:Mediator complex protein
MSHTTKALTSLSHQPDTSTEDQEETFKSAMNDMLTTLHRVDVLMKRQIWALEEAGIIKLAAAERVTVDAEAKLLAKSSLEPNGVGSIGNLDVGWLNSRSSKVERDMEAELWGRARKLLERVASPDGERMES